MRKLPGGQHKLAMSGLASIMQARSQGGQLTL